MALNTIYKEVEKEKKNKPKKTSVSMDLDDFIEEHKCLIKVLREGSREELLTEAKKQEEELEEYLED